jgi:beta-galactosidase
MNPRQCRSARFAACLFALATPLLWAQEKNPSLTTVLYGASYYHEYMPYERLEQDVRMMAEAGITVVRLGESTWSLWEPREGYFEFAWMDRVIDRLHGAGIKVIFGTPTYSVPPWMFRKHPEIFVTELGGKKSSYGPRQNMDITHPTYLFYAERVIRKLMEHYRDHPAIIGYQIDNETSSYGTAGRNVQRAFVEYLKSKFRSVSELNTRWGLAYWGQTMNGWDEVPPRDAIINPGWKLEWERFQQGIATDFLAWQARIVSEYKRPGQFVTQNFMGGIQTNIDEFAIGKILDVTSVNPYQFQGVQDELDGGVLAISGDLCRSLKQQNYLIMETNAQTVGWNSMVQTPPYDGQLRLNVYSLTSSGANAVLYWHWHTNHYGSETFWGGVLSHDLEPNRAYAEVSRIGAELKKLGPRLVNFKPRNDVAILYSVDSYNGIRFMPLSETVDYLTVLYQLYGSLYRLNVGVDFVFPRSEDLSRYRVLVVPPLYIASDDLLQRLVRYVKDGGHLVLTFKSGYCDEFSRARWTRAPGPLREAAGFSYQEYSNLFKELALKEDPFGAGEKNRVSTWIEFLVPEGATPLAWYDHPFFGRFPALTRNRHGAGTLTYEGTVLSDALQVKVLREVLDLAGLSGPDQQLPGKVRVKKGSANSGNPMRYYLNYSGDAQTFVYPHAPGMELLAGKRIGKGEQLTLDPWGVAIIEEE